eukprot:1669017-Amphidinium_carterae.4
MAPPPQLISDFASASSVTSAHAHRTAQCQAAADLGKLSHKRLHALSLEYNFFEHTLLQSQKQ